MKGRLPAPIASQLDAALSGGAGPAQGAGNLGEMAKGLGGMFGGKS